MFSCNSEQLCDAIYMKNMLILKHLRVWLPPASTSTSASNSSCTRNIVYALSNIVATNTFYLELFLNTDIFPTLLQLYAFVLLPCRIEITHALYNMLYSAHPSLLVHMLHYKPLLLDTLRDMLEERDPVILRGALDGIFFMLESLP